MARGDVALSISLTGLTSLLSVVTVPLILTLALAVFLGPDAPEIGLVTTGLVIFALTVVPVAIGMAVKRFAPAAALAIDRRSRVMASLVFLAVVAAALYADRAHLLERLADAGAIALALNLAAMAVAFAAASLLSLKIRQKIALTLECGLQNGALAIVVAGTLLGDVAYATPAAVYGVLMFATAGGFILWARRWSAPARRARRVAA